MFAYCLPSTVVVSKAAEVDVLAYNIVVTSTADWDPYYDIPSRTFFLVTGDKSSPKNEILKVPFVLIIFWI